MNAEEKAKGIEPQQALLGVPAPARSLELVFC